LKGDINLVLNILSRYKRGLTILSLILAFTTSGGVVLAQQNAADKKGGVVFKIPKGYMPMDFPKHKGVMMLHPKKPAGMFVVYPNESQKAVDLIAEIKPTLARMFIHDAKTELVWNTTPLNAHQNVADESGSLMTTSDAKMEMQVAAYTRTVGAREVVYGYFGMRHKGTGKDDDAKFLDAAGEGVEDFDKFWKTIKAGK
jgi:hypothetical protein